MYRVQVRNAIYRRNQRQLNKTGESSEATLPEDMFTQDDLTSTSDEALAASPRGECPQPNATTEPGRSQCQIKPPVWLKDFVTP